MSQWNACLEAEPRIAPRRGAPEVGSTAAEVAWGDLSKDEQTALKRLNRGPYPDLADDTAARLIGLGMAAARPGGIGISRAGRELVIDTLLRARLSDSDRP